MGECMAAGANCPISDEEEFHEFSWADLVTEVE